MNWCEKCECFILRQVRLLPTSRGPEHGNMILCEKHYKHEMAYREQMVQDGLWAKDATDFPRWEDLLVYNEE